MRVCGYFDFAGGEDTGHLVIGGYFATPDAWTAFSDAWREVLRVEPAVPRWHKREIGPHQMLGRLLGWAGVRAREQQLRRVIAAHELEGFSQSVCMAQYGRYISLPEDLANRVGMFWVCFASFLRRVQVRFEPDLSVDGVDLYIEPSPKLDWATLVVVLSYFDTRVDPDRRGLVRMHRVTGDHVKDRFPQLQAADMLAWNIHKGNRDMKHELSQEYTELKSAAQFGHSWTMDKDVEAYSKILDLEYDPNKDTEAKRYQAMLNSVAQGAAAVPPENRPQ